MLIIEDLGWKNGYGCTLISDQYKESLLIIVHISYAQTIVSLLVIVSCFLFQGSDKIVRESLPHGHIF